MGLIKLIKPTIEFADDIMSFRQEMLDTNDSFAGCGSLKKCSSVNEWIKILNDMEIEESCPKGVVTSNTYIAVRLSDNRLVGIIDLRHHINHPILKANELLQIYNRKSNDTIYIGYLCESDCEKNSITLQEEETISFIWLNKKDFLDFVQSDKYIPAHKKRLEDFLDTLREN